jgi:hypothetical protein
MNPAPPVIRMVLGIVVFHTMFIPASEQLCDTKVQTFYEYRHLFVEEARS